jgi:type IV pilus assembly protein PilV
MQAHKCQHQTHGFSLIEVLITLFVFAIGLLTVAGLQLYSKKANYDAIQRSTASMLAYSMVERMRSNSKAQAGADPLARYVDQTTDGLGGATLSTPATNCGTTDCNNIQMVDYDLWQWERAIDGASVTANSGTVNTGGLVSPTACITGPAAGGAGAYNIIIAWRGAQPLSNPTIDAAPIGPCGTSTGRYGTNNVYRRVLVVPAFITPSS